METPKEGIDIICKWEGFHRRLKDGRAAPYACPAKVITIAYGATRWLDGRPIKMTDEAITEEVGKQLLLKQLQGYAAAVDRAVKVKIHPQMRASLISICYNIGTGAFAKSTLVRRVNAREWAGCPEAFKRYKIGGGRILTGLLSRRIDEAGLFMRGVAKLTESPVAAATPAEKAQILSGPEREGFWAKVARGILAGLGLRPSPIPG